MGVEGRHLSYPNCTEEETKAQGVHSQSYDGLGWSGPTPEPTLWPAMSQTMVSLRNARRANYNCVALPCLSTLPNYFSRLPSQPGTRAPTLQETSTLWKSINYTAKSTNCNCFTRSTKKNRSSLLLWDIPIPDFCNCSCSAETNQPETTSYNLFLFHLVLNGLIRFYSFVPVVNLDCFHCFDHKQDWKRYPCIYILVELNVSFRAES